MVVAQKDLAQVQGTADEMHLHTTHFCPSDVQAKSLRSSLDEEEKLTQEINSKIFSLKAELDELEMRQVTLVQSSALKRALLAPIRRLAPEILGEIFEWCLQQLNPSDPRGPATPDEMPLLLGWVCTGWRAVALGTPSLWTTINLEGKKDKDTPEIIATWLRRSGTLPIDIYLGTGLENLYYRPEHAETFKLALQIIKVHFHRFRTLHAAACSILCTLFPESQRTHAPLLRNLQVTHCLSSSHPSRVGGIVAPSLRNLDLCCPHILMPMIMVNFPLITTVRWDASISYRQRSLETLAELITMCPNLEECSIQYPLVREDTSNGITMIYLPRLRRLSLTFPTAADPTHMLSIIEAPSLESLALYHEEATIPIPGLTTALESLISGESAPLKELRVSRIKLSPGDILFLPLPNLESLHFEHSCFHDAFLPTLTPTPGVGPTVWPLPKLRSLSLDYTTFDIAQLVRMIEGRASKSGSSQEGAQPLSVSILRCSLSQFEKTALMELVRTHTELHVNISG